MIVNTVDRSALETKVKSMYTDVATNPHGSFHFEMGRAMAERLGYAAADLDRTPQDAIDSFAGVGHFFHLADLKPGEHVVDLGSGSGSRVSGSRASPQAWWTARHRRHRDRAAAAGERGLQRGSLGGVYWWRRSAGHLPHRH